MEYKYNVSPEKYLYSGDQKRSISKTRTDKNSIINKKFKLSSAFDHKGSKHFLNSKKIALQQIVLDDETCLDESETEMETNKAKDSPKYRKYTCKRSLPNDDKKKHLKVSMKDINKKNIIINKNKPEKMKSTNINNPFRKVYPSSTNNQRYLSKKSNIINKEVVSHKFYSNQEIKMFEDKDIKKIKPIKKSNKEIDNESENKKNNNIAENISFMEKNDSSIIDIITNLK